MSDNSERVTANRELAEWLGGFGPVRKPTPDFYSSEEASAMLLEKIRIDFHVNVSLRELAKVCIKYKRTPLAHRGCRWQLIYSEDADRKTAIAEAARKLAMAEKEKR